MYDNKTRKVIEINPDLFTLKKSVKNKKPKKLKAKPVVQSNQVKKELLKKIKDYQKKNQNKINSEEKNKILEKSDNKDIKNNNDEVIFDDEFNKSLNFLTELSKEINVIRINTDTLPKLAAQYNISSIPTIFIYKDGELKDQQIGVINKDSLVEIIENIKNS